MLTADVVLLSPQHDQVLLVLRGNDPYRGCWALPGGFFDVDSDPTIEHTACRELQEETGIVVEHLTLLTIASKQGRDPRGRTVSAVFVGTARPDEVRPVGADDAAEARWWSVSSLPPLAFDHADLLAAALARRADGPIS